MLEAVLRGFTDLDGTLDLVIKSDGSMHNVHKQHHPKSLGTITELVQTTSITTPIYPFASAKLPEILHEYEKLPSWQSDHKILIHAADHRWAELNMLFQYHKIAIGLDLGLDIFGNNTDGSAWKKWNTEYTSFKDMQIWERREWLSLFYPEWIKEWIHSPQQVGSDFLVISNQSLLERTLEVITIVAEFCRLNLTGAIDKFVARYQCKQKYVLDEYTQIEHMLYHVLQGVPVTWERPLSIIGESILQHHFRHHGWEWRCNGLDTLPMNSVEFRDIIYQPDKDLHA